MTTLISFLMPSVQLSQSIELERELQVYYNFNENVLDWSGNDNHGRAGGGVTYAKDRNGNHGACISFNGYNSFVSAEKVFDYPDRSVSVWIRPSQISGITPNNPVILSHDSYTLDHGLIRIDFNRSILNMFASGTSGSYSNSQIDQNTWYHLVLIKEGAIVKYYLNGLLVQESIAGNEGSTFDPIPDLILGAGRSRIRQFYSGLMDEFRFYKRAINECEVAALYLDSNFGVDEALTAFYSCDGNIRDSITNSESGQLFGNISAGPDRFGYPGHSLYFDGIDDIIDLRREFDPVEMTISVWFKHLSEGSSEIEEQIILKHNHVDNEFGLLKAMLSRGKLILFAGGIASELSGISVARDKWYHLVMVRTRDKARYFLNNVFLGERPIDRTKEPGLAYPFLVLGAEFSGSGGHFQGALDELRIYEKALTACEVDKIFRITKDQYIEPEPKDIQVLLYPNPNDGKFQIKLIGIDEKHLKKVRIVDELGRVIFIDQSLPINTNIQLSEAASAVYICQIWVGDKKFSIPFVKAD